MSAACCAGVGGTYCVIAKFGVRADQIADYLALMGDSVDNIPGVPKCGPKTAAKWLQEYGNLQAVIANADKVGGNAEGCRKKLERAFKRVVRQLGLKDSGRD